MANVHVKQGFAKVLAAQGDADLGVSKVRKPWREEASTQGAILCKADTLVTHCDSSDVRIHSSSALSSTDNIAQQAGCCMAIRKLVWIP